MEAITALVNRFERMSEEANVDAVFGKPQTIEGRTLIPVAEVVYGFGMGAGTSEPPECSCGCGDECECESECECGCETEAESEACCEDEACCGDETCCEDEICECGAHEPASGVGGGAGAHVRPIAYIEVGPDGTHVKPIVDEQKVALAGILLGFWAVGWVGLVLKTLFTRRS